MPAILHFTVWGCYPQVGSASGTMTTTDWISWSGPDDRGQMWGLNCLGDGRWRIVGLGCGGEAFLSSPSCDPLSLSFAIDYVGQCCPFNGTINVSITA